MNRNFHMWTAFIVAFWVYAVGPGDISGYIFPVVKDVKLEAFVDVQDTQWVYVSGSFNKNDYNCNPRYLKWYKGDRYSGDTVLEYTWGEPQVRDSGLNVFKDWRVHISPPFDLINASYADVYHQCYISIPIPSYAEGEWIVMKYKVDMPWLRKSVFWK